MNRITKTFQEANSQGKKVLIPFITGGDPNIETTEKLIEAMAKAGADIVQIGVPFSDPVAGGLVVQKADERALSAGCTVDKLFEMVKRLRSKTNIPLIFVTYINPIFVYGTERFFNNCAANGVDGIYVPDLPFEEKEEVAEACAKTGIIQISVAAPSSKERAVLVAKEAEGFLYCMPPKVIEAVKEVANIPCVIDFDPATSEHIKNLADGFVIDTAIVSLIEKHGEDSVSAVEAFIKKTISYKL